MQLSQQTIRGWLSIQAAFFGEYLIAGTVGGLFGLVGGPASARAWLREA